MKTPYEQAREKGYFPAPGNWGVTCTATNPVYMRELASNRICPLACLLLSTETVYHDSCRDTARLLDKPVHWVEGYLDGFDGTIGRDGPSPDYLAGEKTGREDRIRYEVERKGK